MIAHQWKRRRSVKILQPAEAPKQSGGSSSCSSSSSSCSSHSSSSPSPSPSTSSPLLAPLSALQSSLQLPRIAGGLLDGLDCGGGLEAVRPTSAERHSSNRNPGSRNQNFSDEEPEQAHEKLEPSSEQGKVDELSGEGATPSRFELPETRNVGLVDENSECRISVSSQHDADSIFATNTLTSLFAHVDKVKGEVDQLLKATDHERVENEALATKRKESVSTSWRQVMLNQSKTSSNDGTSESCSVDTSKQDSKSDLFTMLKGEDSKIELEASSQTQQVSSAALSGELDEDEREEVRLKLETAQKRTNALIMIDCLTRKRNELWSIDEKLHKMLAECLVDFDITPPGSPSGSASDSNSIDKLHNREMLRAESSKPKASQSHTGSAGMAIDLSTLNSSRTSAIRYPASSSSSKPVTTASDQIGLSTDYVRPLSATCELGARSTSSCGPISEKTKIINLKKSRLLGAIMPASTFDQEKRQTVALERERSASSSHLEARADGKDALPNHRLIRLERASPPSLQTRNHYASVQQPPPIVSEAKMMMMVMMPTESPSTSLPDGRIHHLHDDQQQRSHNNTLINGKSGDFYRHSSDTASIGRLQNSTRSIVAASDNFRTMFSPNQHYLSCPSRSCSQSMPAIDDAESEADQFRPLRPAKRLCSMSQGVPDERFRAAMATLRQDANYHNAAARNDILDMKHLHLEQQQRQAAISEYVHRQFRATISPPISPLSELDQSMPIGLRTDPACVDLRLRMAKQQVSDDKYLVSNANSLVADEAAAYIFATMQHSNKLQHYDYQGLLQSGQFNPVNGQFDSTPPQLNLIQSQANTANEMNRTDKDLHNQLIPMIGGTSNQHLSDVHKMPFRCHVCGSGFEDRHRLQQHLSIHLNLHPSWFEEKTIKETLAQYESKRGDYLCSVCNVRFETTAEFDKHMQLHGDKPHRCELCNHDNKLVCFRYYRQLLTHLRSHCFLYSCRFVPECKQTSNRKDYLKLHILKHHLNNKLPEQYTICCH